MTRARARPPAAALSLILAAACGSADLRAPAPAGTPPAADQGPAPTTGAAAIDDIVFPPLRFDPPTPERFQLSNGATVFFLHDPSLPLVNVFMDIKGGYSYLPRQDFAAATAVGALMKNAGAGDRSADQLDEWIEFNALGMRVTSDGGRIVVGVDMLRRQLDVGLGVWADILLRPRFEAAAVERWRIQELESVRRIDDFPGSLAVLEFNRLMFGDHPTGWRMTTVDLSPERVTPARLHEIHRRFVCPETAVIGAAGDISRQALQAALEDALAGWTRCGTTLTEPPPPALRADPTVYIVHKAIPQSTIVLGQPGGVLLRDDPDYYASRIANWVIGGSGFTSRLMSRLRTEEGLAYSAATIWGSARDHERIFGAITHTKAESTVRAVELALETLRGVVADPPTEAEVELARSSIVNGFVFGFGSPAEVVSRQVGYWADGLPQDWLRRYVDGIGEVTPAAVAATIRRHIDPGAFTILIVGDTTAFDRRALGESIVLGLRPPVGEGEEVDEGVGGVPSEIAAVPAAAVASGGSVLLRLAVDDVVEAFELGVAQAADDERGEVGVVRGGEGEGIVVDAVVEGEDGGDEGLVAGRQGVRAQRVTGPDLFHGRVQIGPVPACELGGGVLGPVDLPVEVGDGVGQVLEVVRQGEGVRAEGGEARRDGGEVRADACGVAPLGLVQHDRDHDGDEPGQDHESDHDLDECEAGSPHVSGNSYRKIGKRPTAGRLV